MAYIINLSIIHSIINYLQDRLTSPQGEERIGCSLVLGDQRARIEEDSYKDPIRPSFSKHSTRLNWLKQVIWTGMGKMTSQQLDLSISILKILNGI